MLTKAVLTYQERKHRVALLFGKPTAVKDVHFTYGHSEKHAFFPPGSIFALETWEANDYGTISWKIYILQAVKPGEALNRLPQVLPGAEILFSVSGQQKVKRVKDWLTALTSQGGDLTLLDADYYRSSHSKVKVNLQPRRFDRPHGKVVTFLKGGAHRR